MNILKFNFLDEKPRRGPRGPENIVLRVVLSARADNREAQYFQVFAAKYVTELLYFIFKTFDIRHYELSPAKQDIAPPMPPSWTASLRSSALGFHRILSVNVGFAFFRVDHVVRQLPVVSCSPIICPLIVNGAPRILRRIRS